MADVDPGRDGAIRKLQTIPLDLDGDSTAHFTTVRDMYDVAWASCVRGRLEGVRRRTGKPTRTEDVANDRNQARVAAVLAAGWMADIDAVSLHGSAGSGPDDVIRNQVGVATVILDVLDSKPFPRDQTEAAERLRAICDVDGVTLLDVERARLVARRDPAAWKVLFGRVAGYARFRGDVKPRFADRAARNIRTAWSADKRVGKKARTSNRFLITKTGNLYNKTPKSQAVRTLTHADVDAFVEARYDAARADIDRDDETPAMLGAFPHYPDRGEEALEKKTTEELFNRSVDLLSAISNAAETRGFTTTSPLLRRAANQVYERMLEVLIPGTRNEEARADLAGLTQGVLDRAPNDRYRTELIARVGVRLSEQAGAMHDYARSWMAQTIDQPHNTVELGATEEALARLWLRSAVAFCERELEAEGMDDELD